MMRFPRLDTLPHQLREADRWVLWRLETVNDRETKVPYQALPGRWERKAASTRPQTWASFADAAATLLTVRRHTGLGFVLGDGWSGVDLDHCFDAETGEIVGWASDICERMSGAYRELSPSRTGIHLILRGAPALSRGRRMEGLPSPDGGLDGHIEVYSVARFFTVTGETL